jgi:diguanylate cyclase (GGDEF)-like protein
MQKEPSLDGHPVAPFLPFRFYAGVPLLTPEGAAVGSFCILKREPQDAAGFDVSTLIDLAAVSMDEVELWQRNQDLERAIQTDGLTGIANRRTFDRALERAIRQAHRTKEPLSLLLLDLDHFKALNDTAGHQAGDEVLRRFAGILAQAARRPDDVAARYGGEEFALIFPGMSADETEAVVDTVREQIASRILKRRSTNEDLGEVTISAGVAQLRSGEIMAALIERADAALYASKRAGRNRVTSAERSAKAA